MSSYQIRFHEFVEYVLHYEQTDDVNVHWGTFQNICLPCKIKYDFVGKLETVDTDVNCLLPWISNNSVSFLKPGVIGPSSLKSKRETTSISMIRSLLYKNISSIQLKGLLGIYGTDCKMFGYNCQHV